MALLEKIQKELNEWLKQTRHEFHQIPELGFNEVLTTKKIKQLLTEFGYKLDETISKTGVVAYIKNGTGKSVAIRADIDALPVLEKNDINYKSKHEGVMHACGHDGHITMGLGAAKYLAKNKNFKGTLYFVFQPAEETGYGAIRMVEKGLFKKHKIDAIFGLHGMPIGNFDKTEGHPLEGGIYFYPHEDAMLASADLIDVKFIGKGGHGSEPETSKDPIPAGLEYVNSVYSIKERIISSKKRTVLSICAINSGTAHNIIPDFIHIKGTLRTTDENVRKEFHHYLKHYATSTAKKYDLKLEYKIWGLPTTTNNPELNEFGKKCAINALGKKMVGNARQVMGGEDFSIFANQTKGCFGFICTGENPALHNSTYNFKDKALASGVAWFVEVVNTFLKK